MNNQIVQPRNLRPINIATYVPLSITTLFAVLSGSIFIPSLALASGVWSGTSKLFEILYLVIWYIGPLNHAVPELDYIGTTSNGYPEFFIPFSIALVIIALIGRARQLQN